MRTTTSNKTIKYMKDGIWSPDMSYEQFVKNAPNLDELSSVVISEYITKEEALELKQYGFIPQEEAGTV